jgi:hypothetical protein
MAAQVPIYNLRSGTADKRPAASGLAFGQIAVNYNEADPAIYLRGHSDDLVKVGPVYIGNTAPNATPASGGASGNTVGEQWLDKSLTPPVQKVWDGSAWVPSFAIGSGSITNTEINASAAIGLSKLGVGALPTGITIASDNIVNGTIVNADINAAAAIALSKLDTGALPTGITVTSGNVADSSILTSAAIGSTVQAFDATILNDADIGVSVQAYDADTAKLDVAQTYTAKQVFDDVEVGGSYAAGIVAMGALDIDCSLGNYFTKTISANSTFTFSNVPTSRAYSLILELTHTSGTITWPAAVKWQSDTAPTLTTGKTHLFMFVTDDSGSRWRGASLVDYVN